VNFFRIFGGGQFFPHFALVIFFVAEIFLSPIGLKFFPALTGDHNRSSSNF
jgi:hypothetical protein